MAESTLSLTYWDALAEVAQYLGRRRSPSDEDVMAEIRRYLEEGYRTFLSPPPLPGAAAQHEWSFLSPEATFETAATTDDYAMPDDFGSIVGDLTVDESGLFWPVPLRGEGFIRTLRARGEVSGRPQYAAIRVKDFTQTTGQRWELMMYPTPDAVYTMLYRYTVLPDKWGTVLATNAGTVDNSAKTITKTGETFMAKGCVAGDRVILSGVASGQTAGTYTLASTPVAETVITLTAEPGADGDCTYEVMPANLYAYGGMRHSTCLLAACTAAAEWHANREQGLEYTQFMALLRASVSADQQMGPSNLGYDGDPGMGVRVSRRRMQYVEYNGTPITE